MHQPNHPPRPAPAAIARALLLAGLLLLALAVTPALAAFEPVLVGGEIDPRLHGVWASRGYGWIVEIGDSDQLRYYDWTQTACLHEEVTRAELAEFFWLFELDADTVRWTAEGENSTVYTFDRIAAVPAHCAEEPARDPATVLRHFGELMATHYAFFGLYDVDWQARLAAAARTVTPQTSDRQLFDLLGGMLDGIIDGHLRLIGEVDGQMQAVNPGRPKLAEMIEARFESQRRFSDPDEFRHHWSRLQRQRLARKLLGRDLRSAADGRLVWGRIGRIGYVGIYGMTRFAGTPEPTLAEEVAGVHGLMARVVADLADTEAMIVDISFNGGGHDEVSLAFAAHFADETTLAYTKVAHGARDAKPQPFYVVPAESGRYLKPVTLLTTNYTVSAAEIFTLAMRALPTVTHRGEATRGAFSDVLGKELVNGWQVTLSNEIYRDAEGELWEGRGVTPEQPAVVFDPERIDKSHALAVREAARALLAHLPS
jgi:carboxyl-terminal processing protease